MYDRLPQYPGAGHVTWSQEQEKAQLPPRDCPERGAAETGRREAARGGPRHPDSTGPEKGDVSHTVKVEILARVKFNILSYKLGIKFFREVILAIYYKLYVHYFQAGCIVSDIQF